MSGRRIAKTTLDIGSSVAGGITGIVVGASTGGLVGAMAGAVAGGIAGLGIYNVSDVITSKTLGYTLD
uniref:Uncharacterized protein n=1 Tax=Acrobeloides nanus TaxID=290746 RepID=A0A914CS03_9BILA